MSQSNFTQRLMASSSLKRSRLVIALDIRSKDPLILKREALRMITATSASVACVKLNYHLLLPLSKDAIEEVVRNSHSAGLQVIADLKLNDISPTNMVVGEFLWEAGFDALIVNPIAGHRGGLDSLIEDAHSRGKGIIFLVYMSHAGAEETFGMRLVSSARETRLYQELVARGVEWGADGFVVGGAQLDILREVSGLARKIPIFSPGIGVQGGDPLEALKAGADYLIVGRSIIDSNDPGKTAKDLCSRSWVPSG